MHKLRIVGLVETGQGLARHLGFPTANIAPMQGLVIPAAGVYLAATTFEGKTYPSVMCVAGGKDRSNFKIEVHLLDVQLDLTGKVLDIVVLERIRDLFPWQDEAHTREAVTEDVKKARAYFVENPVDANFRQNNAAEAE